LGKQKGRLVKKVLLLSYYWPPAGGPGVQRWLKNSIFLREFGWDTIVVTPKEPVASSFDHSLLQEVPEDMAVHHTNASDPFKAYAVLTGKKGKTATTGGIGISNPKSKKQAVLNYVRANFFIPDARKGWNSYALKEARKLIADHDIKAIISTGPPHSTHLAAAQLKKEFDLPWLADFRDPWVNIFYNQFFPRTKRTQVKDQELEDLVLKSTDHVLTVSPGLASEFADRTKKISVLFNGYDPKDIPEKSGLKSSSHFHLSYTGNFKPNQNVETLWEVISELAAEVKGFKDNFRLQFVGNIDPGVRDFINQIGLQNLMVDHGYQSHHFATKVMVDSEALLFIVPQTKDNHLILTGKLFEYLGSCTPLVSIAPPEGNAAEIIEKTGRGNSLDYKAKKAQKARILDLYSDWLANNKKGQVLSREATDTYTRRGSAEQLSKILKVET
jgi:hypothetical protein